MSHKATISFKDPIDQAVAISHLEQEAKRRRRAFWALHNAQGKRPWYEYKKDWQQRTQRLGLTEPLIVLT